MTPDMHDILAAVFQPGAALVTMTALGHEALLHEVTVAHAFLVRITDAVRHGAGRLLGYVLLPDHVHLVVVPAAGQTLDTLMRRVTIGFNQDYAALMGLPGTQSLWQQPYRRWYAADEDELTILLDYVHYDPVRHRLVHRPEEWRHSSYQYWVERKLYKLGWGWTSPASIHGKRFE
ncbi:MAG: hypothetical protein KDE20_16370 [Caldilineaceae bacterium]|nr:hypothetical protein [Caldilineaceae bacterium]